MQVCKKSRAIIQLHQLLVQIVDRDPVRRRFMTVPGTCPAALNIEILAPHGMNNGEYREMAEREGFEPSVPSKGHNGFRDRPVRPLRHLSARLHLSEGGGLLAPGREGGGA